MLELAGESDALTKHARTGGNTGVGHEHKQDRESEFERNVHADCTRMTENRRIYEPVAMLLTRDDSDDAVSAFTLATVIRHSGMEEGADPLSAVESGAAVFELSSSLDQDQRLTAPVSVVHTN